ncbi:MAG: cysteine desulfurase NifS [Anaerovoracaceae bacterium]|nr:cysteine desulfurase NifS [Bacillota bacterium]MDD7734184.1 cysteine desulfurase NifS [Bacillota bacterium]MDY5906983.1 cysteine desulfurase NifS [Anaerovoracaceae bacterium]
MEDTRKVYLDYSATTPTDPRVVEEMIPYFTEHFGNPSSIYSTGLEAKDAIEHAREQVAHLINAEPKELIFTSGGTESDNWALIATAHRLQHKGKHIITSAIEHHAILHSCEYLAKEGFDITYVGVDHDGLVDPAEVEAAIRPDTILISIMYVNNEVGSVQPITEIGAIAKKHGVLFHTDAVQALGNVPIDVKTMNIDMMSMSSHKIYGPKGIGAIYIRSGVNLPTYIHGGAQERKKRAGTENVPGIVGFGKAAELACQNFNTHVAHVSKLRDHFVDRVLNEIPYTYFNGSKDHRHPGNANITFEYVEGESILLYLDFAGVSCSSGSACSSRSLQPSHVLTAMGIPVELIHGSIRFTFGNPTTMEDVDYTVDKLKGIIEKLRGISSISKEKGW